jgi:hypothetical protein
VDADLPDSTAGIIVGTDAFPLLPILIRPIGLVPSEPWSMGGGDPPTSTT